MRDKMDLLTKLTETTVKELMWAIEKAHKDQSKSIVVGSEHHKMQFKINIELEQNTQEKAKMDQILTSTGLLSDLLVPFGKRQERVFNIFYYMNLYGGLAFIDWLYERYEPSLETLEIRL